MPASPSSTPRSDDQAGSTSSWSSADRMRRDAAECLRERWQSDICEALDLDVVIAATDGLSFADLEELRKLLVLHYLEHGAWDWTRTWRVFRRGRTGTGEQPIELASGPLAPTKQSPRPTEAAPVAESEAAVRASPSHSQRRGTDKRSGRESRCHRPCRATSSAVTRAALGDFGARRSRSPLGPWLQSESRPGIRD